MNERAVISARHLILLYAVVFKGSTLYQYVYFVFCGCYGCHFFLLGKMYQNCTLYTRMNGLLKGKIQSMSEKISDRRKYTYTPKQAE